MKILVLIGQRKCSYDGEYAPDAISCISEYGDSDNPDYMKDELLSAENSGDFDRVTIVTLDVSQSSITAALYPERKPIPAKAVDGDE